MTNGEFRRYMNHAENCIFYDDTLEDEE